MNRGFRIRQACSRKPIGSIPYPLVILPCYLLPVVRLHEVNGNLMKTEDLELWKRVTAFSLDDPDSAFPFSARLLARVIVNQHLGESAAWSHPRSGPDRPTDQCRPAGGLSSPNPPVEGVVDIQGFKGIERAMPLGPDCTSEGFSPFASGGARTQILPESAQQSPPQRRAQVRRLG